MKIDNFALSLHQTCPDKHRLRILEGWTSRHRSAALSAGGGLHHGLATWYGGPVAIDAETGKPNVHGLRIPGRAKNIEAAFDAISADWPADHPIEDYRSLTKMLSVMTEYTKEYPYENFQVVGAGTVRPMIEVSFTLDTGMFLSCLKCGSDYESAADNPGFCPNCGEPLEPIQYGGIFDGLVEFGQLNGSLYVLEHKSTSRMGYDYFDQFKPNNQISGYVWAASILMGRKVAGALVNAVGVYKSQATKFQRHYTTRNETELARWLLDVKETCEEIQFHRRRGHWPRRTQNCTMYGHCEFYHVHTLVDENSEQKMLEQNFIRRPWDYENRDGEEPGKED